MSYYDFVITGGGMCGMTTALILKKYLPDKKVLVIEKNNYLGGSVHDEFENGKYIEHSPRVFLNSYENFYNIIKKIPIEKGKTVFDNLTDPLNNTIIRKDGVLSNTSKVFFESSFLSFLKISFFILIGLFLTDEQLKVYDNIDFFSLLDDYSYDKLKIVSHIAGENPKVMPLYKIQNLVENTLLSLFGHHTDRSGKPRNFIGPTSLTLVKPWEQEMLRLGIDIKKEHEVMRINSTDDRAKSILLNDGETIYGENFILAVPPKEIGYLLNDPKSNLLAKGTLNYQESIQIYLNKKVHLKNKGYFSVDSDWQLIIGVYDEMWDKKYIDMIRDDIKSTWSINIANPELYSKRLRKRYSQCSREEIISEIFYQIKDYMNLDLKDFYIDSQHSKVPYYWNSIGTLSLRQGPKTKYKNVFVGGTMTDTTFYSSYVESAVESALIICALFIPQLKYHKHKRFIHSSFSRVAAAFLAFLAFLLFFNSSSMASK